MWLTYLQTGVPLGVFFGYGITAIMNHLSHLTNWIDWRWAFYFQIILLVLCFIFYYEKPRELLSTNAAYSRDDQENALPELEILQGKKTNSLDNSFYSPKTSFILLGVNINKKEILNVNNFFFIFFLD